MACASIAVQKRPFAHLGDEEQMENVRHAKRCRAIALATTSPKKVCGSGVHKSRLRVNLESPFFCSPSNTLLHKGTNDSGASAASDRRMSDGFGDCSAKRRRIKSDSIQSPSSTHEAIHPTTETTPSKCTSQVSQIEPTQTLFTLEQVRNLVEAAVQQKEAELVAKYDQILVERLQDQFNVFTKYLEDSIHKKYSDSETQFSYMS